MRPRGWHLDEKHLRVDDAPISGALMDFGLYLFHNAQRLVSRGTAPYLYLPKLQHHLEARLWNDVFASTQEALGVPHGTIRATVLIETLPAAFQMEEMLYELRDHSYGLNAGRWDYIFSMIKTFRDRPEFVLPDRTRRDDDRAVHARLHRAAGGHLPPARRVRHGRHGRADPVADGTRRRTSAPSQAVREDKRREADAGFDGTWVAHPDVVDVAIAAFDDGARRPPQPDRPAADDVAWPRPAARRRRHARAITEAGLRANSMWRSSTSRSGSAAAGPPASTT